jgi:16S rRNA processing protein RimM
MRICVGQVLGAHGVRGLVKLASFTADPAAIAEYGPLSDGAARRFAVVLRGAHKGHFLAQLDGVDDRDAAEALAGTRLFVERDQLPPPDDDEVYHADVIGLRAETPDGAVLGTVHAFHNFGAGDVLELVLTGGGKPMLPFNRQTVPVIDLAGGRIVVDPPAGLFGDETEREGAA